MNIKTNLVGWVPSGSDKLLTHTFEQMTATVNGFSISAQSLSDKNWEGLRTETLSLFVYTKLWKNKANLRDLIAATGLVISNWIQIVNFSPRVTVKFDGWPCNTIGHLFYATSSFVHHFVAIGEFKLQLQSGNTQSGSNSIIFRAVRPWNLTEDLEKQ